MATTVKLDGIGTRGFGTANTANKSTRAKFVRLMLKAGQSCAKGDVMALDLNATEPDSGYGNNCIKATATVLSDANIGIAAESVTVGANEQDQPVLIQVAGLCDFATIDSGATDGDYGIANAASDIVDVSASTITPYLCVIVKRTESKVYLLNPHNL
jgi:hypothetical protein